MNSKSGSGGRRQGGSGARSGTSANRGLHVRVRTARGRTVGQQKWLQRQLNDPYVAKAKEEGMRSRAAYKLLELDEKLHFLKKGAKVIDLGAAPGGWTQVAVDKVKAGQPGGGAVVAMDINPWDEIKDAKCFIMDFLDDRAPGVIKEALGGKADVVLSDMAANTTGHRQTDHLRIMALAEAAALFAREVLAAGGAFLCKVLQGGTETALLAELKRDFATVKHVKPPASRSDSAELYLLARGFRG